MPFNPAADKTVRVTQIPFNAFGIPAFRNLEDAEAHGAYQDFAMDRNAGTPVIALRSASTNTVIPLTVSGFNAFVVAREITIADDSGFTAGVQTSTVDLKTQADPTYQSIKRVADPAARTIYVKIRHSTTGTSGPWGSYSNTLSVAWTNTGGSGGSTGGGGGEPPDQRPEMLAT